MPGPLVSVIVPVYNGETTVADTIESAARQTYPNLEIVVVDDGSTDDTVALVQSLAAQDPRIRLIRQANGRVGRARNRAIAESTGPFIAPLDADDLWDPAKIERQVRRIQEAGERTGFVYCWSVRIDGSGLVLDCLPRWRVEGDRLPTLLQVNFLGNASTPLFRRRCVEEAGGYDESLRSCEDWDLALKIAARHAVAVVPELLVGYRRSPGAMSSDVGEMWRARTLVAAGVRQRQPELPRALFRQSEQQFALYLAGTLFWSGDYARALLWLLRAFPSRRLWQIVPYILRRLLAPKTVQPRRMLPGVPLDTTGIEGPMIPYERLIDR
jgi:glycosyltransferase involved in cell wall biosynthesis